MTGGADMAQRLDVTELHILDRSPGRHAQLTGGGPDGTGKVHWDHQAGWCDSAHHKTLSPGRHPDRPPERSAYWALAPNGWWSEFCTWCAAWMRAELPDCVTYLCDREPPAGVKPWRDYRGEWIAAGAPVP